VAPSTSINLELVKSISARWERGDYASTEWADEQIEFVIADGPEPARLRGRERMTASLTGFQDAWEEYRSRVEECRELDEERVLVLTYATGRGRTSGLQTAQERANLFHLSGGRVTRVVAYWDRERALAEVAAGRARRQAAIATTRAAIATTRAA
jgi:ketosteroid isomerase-like protein